MNIVHIAPSAPYNEGWGYQENLLPRFQKKMGHNLTLITTNKMRINGIISEVDCKDWISQDGFRVIRLRTVTFPGIFRVLYSRLDDVYETLCELKPDVVFFHGMVSGTIFDVVKYKRKVSPNLIIMQDNHLDYQIGTLHLHDLKNSFFRFIMRFYQTKTNAWINKYWGVTPWRKKYAEEIFGAPSEKTDVLIMGADDDSIDFENRYKIRTKIREKYEIDDNVFLIVSGGKIDKKKNIDVLMEAIRKVKGVKLIVFGDVDNGLKNHFNELINDVPDIIFVGWIDSNRVYDYFFAADLVFFPGQHSVLWEQACASKVPCVFKKWEGMEHVNNGGNSDFISDVNADDIAEKIEELKFTEKYYQMKKVAESDLTDIYLYSHIALKSLEGINE